MAVYLKVVPKDASRTSGGAHTLSDSECLVFFLGGVPASPSKPTRHSGGLNVLLCDGSVRFAPDLDAIATELARVPPSGVSAVIIGPAQQTGYVTMRWELSADSKQAPSLGLTGTGGNAVLIGLLLPAVQVARQAARAKAPVSTPIQKLASIVGATGHVFVIDKDSTLLPF
jgi:prepilin-type processing-associated H-X9-DG protein